MKATSSMTPSMVRNSLTKCLPVHFPWRFAVPAVGTGPRPPYPDRINVEPVDERDGRWEDDRPRFRVYVFDELGYRIAQDGSRGPGYMTSTWDVTGGDLLDAVRWAQDKAGAQGLYSLALVVDRVEGGRSERGLVWLVGQDYQDRPTDDREREVLSSMLERRGRQIVGPA
jgi:hypothetical protein